MGGTPTPSNADSITRNANATISLPSENEWYKAAYYNPATSSYYSYATSSNTAPTASGPTATPNSANYNMVVENLTPVGAYSGTTSPYGAYDMNGDVLQWNEAFFGSGRGLEGGSFVDRSVVLQSSDDQNWGDPTFGDTDFGFRLVLTPEPSTLVLFGLGAAGVLLAARRRKR